MEDRRELFEKYGWWNEYLEAVDSYDAYPVGQGKISRGMGKQANLSYMQNYFHYRFEDYYQKVKCPLLMLVEKDLENECEKTAILGLSKLAKQAQIAEINDWAHPYMWFLTPEDAIQVILKFLSDIEN